MAIHTKVGILTHVPGSTASVTPGLIDGIYADFLTKEFDFLDDPRMAVQNAWFTNDPWEYTNHHTGDWEDLAGIYRQWRDAYKKAEGDYWLTRYSRSPFLYQNFVQDPSGWANSIETIRLVWPAPNGEFNLPYPNPTYTDGYSFTNSSRPLKHNMTRIKMPSLKALYDQLGYNEYDCVLDEPFIDPITGEESLGGEDLLMAYRWHRDQFARLMTQLELTQEETETLAILRDFFVNFDFSLLSKKSAWDNYSEYWFHNPTMYSDDTSVAYPLGTLPSQVFAGVEKINILPKVRNISELPSTGNPGDVVYGFNFNGDAVLWDPINSKWSESLYGRFLEDVYTFERQRRDSRLKAKNELELAMRPFTFAGLHVPAFSLDSSNVIVK